MRAFAPWLAVVAISIGVHAIAAVAGWGTAATYVVLVAVGFPSTVLLTAWADRSPRRDGRAPDLG